jgi:hypothetical protein
MEERLIQNARTYTAHHQLCLAERLGFGIHGIVFVAENNMRELERLDVHMVDVSPSNVAFLD